MNRDSMHGYDGKGASTAQGVWRDREDERVNATTVIAAYTHADVMDAERDLARIEDVFSAQRMREVAR